MIKTNFTVQSKAEKICNMKTYQELIVWQKSMDLVHLVYQHTQLFPKNELYNLINQIRRSAVSIPSNIAEGYCRHYRREYIQFLGIAFASAAELETQLLLAERLKFLSQEDAIKCRSLLTEIMKMLNKMTRMLSQPLNPNP